MVNFKDLFRFSQKEVSCLFENAATKVSWRGLKLLQAPLDCFEDKSSQQKPSYGKLLIVTPRSCGKANQRNLFRRRVKSIFYSNKLYLYPVNSVVIAYKNATLHDFDHLQEFLVKSFTQPHKKSVTAESKDTSDALFKSGKIKLWQRFFIATFDVIRPVFGFIGGACIYPISCSDYAKHTICTKPFYKSIPLIVWRVLSCNPLTAILMRWKRARNRK